MSERLAESPLVRINSGTRAECLDALYKRLHFLERELSGASLRIRLSLELPNVLFGHGVNGAITARFRPGAERAAANLSCEAVDIGKRRIGKTIWPTLL